MNKNGAHSPSGSGTIRSCGLVGVGVALLEEVCPLVGGGADFEVSEAQPGVLALFLLPADLDVEILTPYPTPRLPAHCHASLIKIRD